MIGRSDFSRVEQNFPNGQGPIIKSNFSKTCIKIKKKEIGKLLRKCEIKAKVSEFIKIMGKIDYNIEVL